MVEGLANKRVPATKLLMAGICLKSMSNHFDELSIDGLDSLSIPTKQITSQLSQYRESSSKGRLQMGLPSLHRELE